MTTATITRPASNPSKGSKSPFEKRKRSCGSGTKACENCRRKTTTKVARKKPRRKGTWRGAFRGTLDF